MSYTYTNRVLLIYTVGTIGMGQSKALGAYRAYYCRTIREIRRFCGSPWHRHDGLHGLSPLIHA